MRAFSVLLICLCCVVTAFAGRRRGNAPDLATIQLPADFSIDYSLALNNRAKVTGGSAPVTGTKLNEAGDVVFQALTQESMVSGLGLPYKWRLTVLDDGVMNAGSLSDGEITVNGANGGLASLIGTNKGLWAAVLSHEISHTAYRHGVRQFMYQYQVQQQIAYYEWRVRNGDKNANWSIVGLRIGSAIAAKKLSRDLEHDADVKGMMLMARAGYHPDNIFALNHLMRLRSGEQSKFAAFFSDHPSWETRDQRDEKAYSDAVAEYNRLWPSPELSPGGNPSTVVFLGQPHSVEDKKQKLAEVQVPLLCRNSKAPLTVVLKLAKDGHPVQGAEGFKDESGNFSSQTEVACTGADSEAHFELPAGTVSDKERKLKAEAFVFEDRALMERSKQFDVVIPKR
ncbi:MAG: M48 family metalloprotease [Terriglobales bacterium]